MIFFYMYIIFFLIFQEIEQLQDKLTSISKHLEVVEGEKKSVEVEVEGLRREMAGVQSERDKYRRERNDMSGIHQVVEGKGE